MKKIFDDLKVKFDAQNDQQTPAMATWTDALKGGAEWEAMSAWRAHKNPVTEGCAELVMVCDKLIELAKTFSIDGLAE